LFSGKFELPAQESRLVLGVKARKRIYRSELTALEEATHLKQPVPLTTDSAAVSRQNVAKPHPIPCDNLLTFARVEVAGGKTAR
jgi:hypothetical protein